jgi:ATP-dependent Clp protease ATP-binding subunit ClpC
VLLSLAQPKRSFRNALFRCKGSGCGAFLALEAGLHRMVLPKRQADEKSDDDRAHVYVHLCALESELPADAWAHRALAPPDAGTAATRRRGVAAREHDRVEQVVLIAGRRRRIEMDPAAYWARLEEITLAHLLLFEDEDSGLTRDDVYLPAKGLE